MSPFKQKIKNIMCPDDMSPRKMYMRRARQLEQEFERPMPARLIARTCSPEDEDGYDRYLDESEKDAEFEQLFGLAPCICKPGPGMACACTEEDGEV